MFLNNTLYENGICNGSICVIIKVHNEESLDVAFLTKSGLSYVTINRTIDRFTYNNGQLATRRQFPIQNAFSLTVHKTQVADTTFSLDEQMFAPGQAYVAISRVETWDSLNIITLDPNAIKTDQQIIDEYKRLQDS